MSALSVMDRNTSESDSDCNANNKTSDFENHCQRRKRFYNEKKKHKCDYGGCGKTFYRPSKLQAHKRLHEGQRPFVCSSEGCGKAYTNSSHLKRHIKICHDKLQTGNLLGCTDKEYEAVLQNKQCLEKQINCKHTDMPECTECKSKFKRSLQLEHAYINGKDVDLSICKTCRRNFDKCNKLKNHQQCHKLYTCGLLNCSETFSSISLRRKHVEAVHKPDHVCDVCKKRFTSRSNLQAHRVIHLASLGNMWDCPHEDCSATFSLKRYLKQHMRNVHEMKIWPPTICSVEIIF